MKKELLTDLVIDFASPIPVYEQIKKIIRLSIAKQTLVEEEPLPSIREMAGFLKINPNTVARAYRELSQEGVIGGRAGKGFWIAKNQPSPEQNIPLLKEEFTKFLEKAMAMGFTPDLIQKVVSDFFREVK